MLASRVHSDDSVSRGHETTVPLPEVARTIVKEYLAKARPGAAASEPLFQVQYVRAANNFIDVALTSTSFTIAIASWTNCRCAANQARKSCTPLDFRSSMAALTREKSSSQIDTRVDSKMWR